jgi:hypothetical protein
VPREEKVIDCVPLLITIEKGEDVTEAVDESVTDRVIGAVTICAGIPEITPVDELSVRPVGNTPLAMAKVFPPEPPEAFTVSEYAVP